MADDPLFQSTNDFTADLFSNLNVQYTNLVFSPFSILSMLYLLLRASEGNTKKEITKAVRINSEKETYLYENYKNALNEDSFLFNDYIMLHSTVKLVQNFTYKDNITKVDFTNGAETAKQINYLVSQATRGRIKNIVNANSIHPHTLMQVINTVFFKGLWEYEFKQEQMAESTFTNADNSVVTVDMLKSKINRLYGETKTAKIVELPYLSSNLAMLVVLPHKNDIDKFILKLPNIQESLLTTKLHDTKVDFAMPKFKFENDLKLNDVLTKMGLKETFSNADLSRMLLNTPIQISDISHAAVIEVDEKGTKAAAASKISVVSYSFIQTSQFVCDRPFLFYIIDRETRIPLFTGAVKNLPHKFPTG